jgi:hypothetical protein
MKFSAAALFVMKWFPAILVYAFSRRKRIKFFQNDLFHDETGSKKSDLGAFFAKKIDFFSHELFSWRKKLKNFYFALFLGEITRWIFDSIRVFTKKTGVFLCCITSFGSGCFFKICKVNKILFTLRPNS